MASVKMKGPRNSGGFTVGAAIYAPDAEGNFEIAPEHVDQARTHGLVPEDPVVAEALGPQSDPNIERVGDPQPAIQPGGDATGAPLDAPVPPPAPEGAAPAALSDEEAAKALADAAAAKGALLDDAEKATVLEAAVAAKNAPADEAVKTDPAADATKGKAK